MPTDPPSGSLVGAPGRQPPGYRRRGRRLPGRTLADVSLIAAAHDDAPDGERRRSDRDAAWPATERRRDVRIATPDGLSARIWLAGGPIGPVPILSLSARGLLLSIGDVMPLQSVRFELLGEAWRFTGRARLVERRACTAAFKIVEWDGHARARVYELSSPLALIRGWSG